MADRNLSTMATTVLMCVLATVGVIAAVCPAMCSYRLTAPLTRAILTYSGHFALNDLRSVLNLNLLGHLKPERI